MTHAKKWEKKVLDEPGAAKRVAEIEGELRLVLPMTNLDRYVAETCLDESDFDEGVHVCTEPKGHAGPHVCGGCWKGSGTITEWTR